MDFRAWCKQQITHHDNRATRFRTGSEARAYHEGAADLAHRALTAYEKDQNQQHKERMQRLDNDLRPTS